MARLLEPLLVRSAPSRIVSAIHLSVECGRT
jgi:hypothetical protein